MQSHFNESLESFGESSFTLVVLAGLVLAVAMSVTIVALLFLREKPSAKKSRMTGLSLAIVGALVSAASLFVFATELNENAIIRAERPAAVRQLVVDTLKPTFEDENVAALKLLPVGSTGGQEIPELRLSADTGEPEFVLSSLTVDFHNMNLSAWANDLSEGEKPTVQVLYQDGKIETLDAEFTSDGEFALSSSE